MTSICSGVLISIVPPTSVRIRALAAILRARGLQVKWEGPDGHVTGKARIVHHRICGLTVLNLKLGEPPAAVEPYFFESLTVN